MSDGYDVIVVGSGSGGGTVAAHAAEAGLSVLLLERGPAIPEPTAVLDHLRNTLRFRYPNVCMGPAGSDPRVADTEEGAQTVEPPHRLHVSSPYNVGGGSLTWGMQAWRFHPHDFRMATQYGIPAGSSLADWPISYEDLEPYYSRAEVELGVAGRNGDSYCGVARSSPYPLEPFPESDVDRWLAAGAKRCGWNTEPVPLAVNTAPFNGHPACIRCNRCIGFACPVNAKNGSYNVMIPRALATDLCDLVPDARAVRVNIDNRGEPSGVEYLTACGGAIERRSASARSVVLAAGAIETARLLLLSQSRHHRAGLGNRFGHVGRHLQTHTYPAAQGLLPPEVQSVRQGPGVGIATLDVAHGNSGVIGGGLLLNDFVKTPLGSWEGALPPGTPRWGAAGKQAMRDFFRRVVDVRGLIQEIPTPELRVTLDPSVRDAAGVPAAHLRGKQHPETLKAAAFVNQQAVRWLQEAGASQVWSVPTTRTAFHQAGTARMSARPEDGVTDPSGRVHGHSNLFVTDAAVHVTNGATNPSLTTYALAMRTSENIIQQLA
jgi:choline dehydrogenase-like flavoprotein